VPDQNTIALSPNGPLYVRGRIKVSSASGQALFDGSRVALCRCGASKRKPFCDGAHETVRFADPGQVASLPTTTADVASGVLEITPSTDGPLLLKGAYRVLAAGADPSEPLGKGALCRCGQSQSRPFCDGSHTRVGFSAE
jgi:CDGSH-type Zn-finger protein